MFIDFKEKGKVGEREKKERGKERKKNIHIREKH